MKKDNVVIQFLIIFFATALISFGNASDVWGHLEGVPFHNGGGGRAGEYWVNTAVDPYFAVPNKNTGLVFSVQDDYGNDVYGIYTMVEIYDSANHNRIFLQPWKYQKIGDFTVDYTFKKPGLYQVVLSVSDSSYHSTNQPARDILFYNMGCNCHRTVSNVAISESFGVVWDIIMGIVVVMPITVFGSALYLNYRRTSKNWRNRTVGRLESFRYIVMLTAIASGIVHFLVYAQHASMRVEWSLFLLISASLQVTYGVNFLVSTMTKSHKIKDETRGFTDMRPSKALAKYLITPMRTHLIGILGNASLIGLYIYVIIFPAPLSPDNLPEDLSILGILSKTTEVLGLFSIYWLIRLERHVSKVINAKDIKLHW